MKPVEISSKNKTRTKSDDHISLLLDFKSTLFGFSWNKPWKNDVMIYFLWLLFILFSG